MEHQAYITVTIIININKDRVPTTLQNSFSLTLPDKMNNFPTNFLIRDTSKTILSTQM